MGREHHTGTDEFQEEHMAKDKSATVAAKVTKTKATQTAAAKTAAKTSAKTAAPRKPAPSKPAVSRTAPATAAAAKPAAAKPRARAAKPKAIAVEQRRNYVEVAAYYIAERRGFAPGDALQDWIAAEAEIDRLLTEGLLGG
jgi:hypothetical protein